MSYCSDDSSSSGSESVSALPPVFDDAAIENERKLLFPQRETTLEEASKTKTTKTRKQYSEMVEMALYELNEPRTGSSRQAIVKYIIANFEVGNNPERYIRMALAKLVENNRIVQKTGVGANGSFILSKEVRETMRKVKTGTSEPKAKASSTKPLKNKADNAKRKVKEKVENKGNSKVKTKTTKVNVKGKDDKDIGDSSKENQKTRRNITKASADETKKAKNKVTSKATTKTTKGVSDKNAASKGKTTERNTKSKTTTVQKKTQATKAKGNTRKARGKTAKKENEKEIESGSDDAIDGKDVEKASGNEEGSEDAKDTTTKKTKKTTKRKGKE